MSGSQWHICKIVCAHVKTDPHNSVYLFAVRIGQMNVTDGVNCLYSKRISDKMQTNCDTK
jgi:hypothetical protein